MWDGWILPAFQRFLREPAALDGEARETTGREMDEVTANLEGTPPESLPAFCLAPFWARMDWLRDYTPFPRLVDERPALRDWLDGALGLSAVQRALPDRDGTVEQVRKRFGLRPLP